MCDALLVGVVAAAVDRCLSTDANGDSADGASRFRGKSCSNSMVDVCASTRCLVGRRGETYQKIATTTRTANRCHKAHFLFVIMGNSSSSHTSSMQKALPTGCAEGMLIGMALGDALGRPIEGKGRAECLDYVTKFQGE